VPPAVKAKAVDDVTPGWEKYAESLPVTSTCRPISDGLVRSPHAERNVDGICT
jgi:hypothetical protein